jgi:predicted dithiol-disulfide oxidoreductase (DUF899 family)
MTVPTAVVTPEERHARREALLVKENELICARDALAAERRRLPTVRAERDYRQETFQDAPDGVPQDRTGSWVRRSDEYSPDEVAGGRA